MSLDEEFDKLKRDMADLEADAVQKASREAFTHEELVAHLEGADAMNSIIKGHLYFEHILSTSISDALPRPDELDIRRLGFLSKLDLTLALGVLPPEFRRAGTCLNEIRNKVAHRLNFSFADEHYEALWESLPTPVRMVILEHRGLNKLDTEQIHMNHMLIGMVVFAETNRRHAAIGRAKDSVAAEHLKGAIRIASPAIEARTRSQPTKSDHKGASAHVSGEDSRSSNS